MGWIFECGVPTKNARKNSIRVQSGAIRIFLGDLLRPGSLLEKLTKNTEKIRTFKRGRFEYSDVPEAYPVAGEMFRRKFYKKNH